MELIGDRWVGREGEKEIFCDSCDVIQITRRGKKPLGGRGEFVRGRRDGGKVEKNALSKSGSNKTIMKQKEKGGTITMHTNTQKLQSQRGNKGGDGTRNNYSRVG